MKKYSQEKFHHHDKHQKVHLHKYPTKHEKHSTEGKQHKVDDGYHEVPKHEVELQKDIKATKKETEDPLAKEEQDLHLQDLTHPSDPANIGHKNLKNPHGYQNSHPKANHHSTHSEGQKTYHHKVKEEKLFDFPETKEPELKQAHPVLENSFETVREEVVHEQPEQSHSKKRDSSKNNKSHKKRDEKVKEKTKRKEYEKTKSKDDKKDKKKQYKQKKEKQ